MFKENLLAYHYPLTLSDYVLLRVIHSFFVIILYSSTIREDSLKEVFYGCCDDEVVEKAKSRLTPQALSALSTKLGLTEEKFGRIPKYYIESLQDYAITIQCQRQMVTATPCDDVYTIDTDHSPFYSTPDELASKLLLIGQKS